MPEVTMEGQDIDKFQRMIYTVKESPPVHILTLLAIQQCLMHVHSFVTSGALVAEVVCADNDKEIETKVLSTTMLMCGVATFGVTTLGVRLPVFQGPAFIYLTSLALLTSLESWQCPQKISELDPLSNETRVYAIMDNGTKVPHDEVVRDRLGQLSGSLTAAGVVHTLIGATGLTGVILRYVGPVSVVPTILLIGIHFFPVSLRFSQSSWAIASITVAVCVIFSLYLQKRNTPIPFWSKEKGFHILWYPFHNVFAILFGTAAGWIASAIMTTTGSLSDDPTSREYPARTDAYTDIVEDIDWITSPYPGHFDSLSFDANAFINFLIMTILSVIDSVADYTATAQAVQVVLPPDFACNRGIAIEGTTTILGGVLGCCHATASYGSSIGIMGITRVASRRVFQLTGILVIVMSLCGKLGAVFSLIPRAVIGGTQIISIGLFLGLILGYSQLADMKSNRNLAIMGMSLYLGFILPAWMKQNPDAFDTGNSMVDDTLKLLLSSPAFVGAVFACILDNSVSGTLKERGLCRKGSRTGDVSEEESFKEGIETYYFPYIPDTFRRSVIARFIPVIHSKK